jgi:hypothetical protein
MRDSESDGVDSGTLGCLRFREPAAAGLGGVTQWKKPIRRWYGDGRACSAFTVAAPNRSSPQCSGEEATRRNGSVPGMPDPTFIISSVTVWPRASRNGAAAVAVAVAVAATPSRSSGKLCTA